MRYVSFCESRGGFLLARTRTGRASCLHMEHIVITGGSGGLGSAIAEEFRTAGHDVAAPSSHDLDVKDARAVSEWFRERPVDLLVCCAGITRDAPLPRLTPGAWDDCWQVNFSGAVACVQAALPLMKKCSTGHIVFISSYSAYHPPAGQAAYASAKAALIGWMADHAAPLGAHGVRVNALFPGFLETKMTASVSEKRRAEVLASHALGRFNTPENAARFIRFLHEEMPHTSGQVFNLDSRPFPF